MWKKNSIWIISALFFVAFMIIQFINHRFLLNDFKVYHSAALRFIEGGQVYGEAFGLSSGFYKYSPFALIAFATLALLDFAIAAVIWYFLITIAIVVLIYQLWQLLFANKTLEIRNKYFALIFIISLTHLYRELHLGNINIMLDLLFLNALILLLKKKNINAGVIIGIGILFKPHFVILLPLLLMRKHYTSIATTILTIITGLFIPALVIGYSKNIELLSNWLITMKNHNSSIIESQETIYAWVSKVLINPIFGNTPQIIVPIILAIIALSFLAYILFHFNQEKTQPEILASSFIKEFFILLALVPNLTLTDSEHFLYSLPLIAMIVEQIINKRITNKAILCLIIIAFVFYGGNWYDLLGRNLSGWVSSNGILGLGNMMLIALWITQELVNSRKAKLEQLKQ